MKTILLSAVLATFGLCLGDVDDLVNRGLARYAYPQGRTNLILDENEVAAYLDEKRERERYRRW